ncbi:MAG: PKD domain-containing protein, partial [Akkermansiaceae bacterium]
MKTRTYIFFVRLCAIALFLVSSHRGLSNPLTGTYEFNPDQTNPTENANLECIQIDGVTYYDFIAPDSYSNIDLNGDSVIRLNTVDQGITPSSSNWEDIALEAYQSRNLNYYQQVDSGNNDATWRLGFDDGINADAELYIFVTERNGNNSFMIEAFDSQGNSLGALNVQTSDYTATGATSLSTNLNVTEDICAAVYPLNDLIAPNSAAISYIEITNNFSNIDGGDGKVFLFGDAATVNPVVASYQFTPDQTTPTEAAFLTSIEIEGVTYSDLIGPDSYTNIDLNGQAEIRLNTADTGVRPDDETWEATALPAFQSRNLNYIQQLDTGNYLATWQLGFDDGINVDADLYIFVTERNGNNPFFIEAFDVNGNSLGTLSVQTSHYSSTGATSLSTNLSATEEIFAAVYPLTGLAPLGSADISYIQITNNLSDVDGGDGKVFFFGDATTVTPGNVQPSAISQTLTTAEETALPVTLSGSDSDGDALTYVVSSSPTNGTLSGTAPNLTYTPNTNFDGNDSFTFLVNDGTVDSEVATVSINVTSANNPPVAQDSNVETPEGVVLIFTLNGSDPDGDDLSYAMTTLPTNGNAVLNGNEVTYTPNVDYKGIDSLTFTVNDGLESSLPASVRIKVDSAPVVVITSPSDASSFDGDSAIRVSANASDLDDPIASLELFANGDRIGWGENGNLVVTWIPPTGGEHVLTAKVISKDGASAEAVPVVIYIIEQNQAPVVTAGSDQHIVIDGVLGNELIINGSNEADIIDGTPEGWQRADDFLWGKGILYTSGGYEGVSEFSVESSSFDYGTAELYQDVDLSVYEADIQRGNANFVFSVQTFAYDVEPSEVRDNHIPKIILEFWDSDTSSVLSVESIEPQYGGWFPAFASLRAPLNADKLRVRLLAINNPDELSLNSVAFDAVSVKFIKGAQVYLAGQVSDDGLPDGQITTTWSQIEGPEVSLENTDELNNSLSLSAPGQYVFQLSASDGELVSIDQVSVTVTGVDLNLPPVLSVDATIAIDYTRNYIPLNASVSDDGLPNDTLSVYWSIISGSGLVYFSDANDINSSVAFQYPGDYKIRVVASDGVYQVSKDVDVTLLCHTEKKPLDLLIAIDNSGSMSMPLDENLYDGEPVFYYAKSLALDFISMLDLEVDRVGVAAMSELKLPITNDFDQVKDTVLNMTAPIPVVIIPGIGGASTIPQLGIALDEMLLNGRPDTEKVIIIFNDAPAGWYSESIDLQDQGHAIARENGIRVIIMSSLSGYASMASDTMRALVTQPSDYYEAALPSDLPVVFDSLLVESCDDYNEAPEVNAGDEKWIASIDDELLIGASYQDDGLPIDSEYSIQWEKIHGPGEVSFSNSDKLNTYVNFSETGQYLLKVSVNDGNRTGIDTISVGVGSTCGAKSPSGLIHWWRADYTLHDSISNSHFEHYVASSSQEYGDGFVRNGFVFDGSPDAGLKADISSETILDSTFSIEGWFNVNEDTGRYTDILEVGDLTESYTSPITVNRYDGELRCTFYLTSESGDVDYTSLTITDDLVFNEYFHLCITSEKIAGGVLIKTYFDGSLTNTKQILNEGDFPDFSNVQIGNKTWQSPSANPYFYYFVGAVDELSIYDRPLNDDEVVNIYLSGDHGKCSPSLDQVPSVDAGEDRSIGSLSQSVTLNAVIIDDSALLDIKWELLSGPDQVTFSAENLASTDVMFHSAGIYIFKVTADDGYNAASDLVELRVAIPCEASLSSDAILWLKGNNTLQDSARNLETQEFSSLSYSPAQIGQGFEFGPDFGYLIVQERDLDFTLPDDSNGFTVECWIRLEDQGANNYNSRVVTWRDNDQGSTRSYITQFGDYLQMHIWDEVDTSYDTITVRDCPLDEYFHFAVTYSKEGLVTGYVNGVVYREELGFGDSSVLSTGESNLYVGGYYDQVTGPLGLDEFTVYKRSFTQNEIITLAGAQTYGKCSPSANSAPVVDAGSAIYASDVSDLISLSGSVYDAEGDDLSVSWSFVSGPGSLTFGDVEFLSSTVSFSSEGTYVLKLAVSDGEHLVEDTVSIFINNAVCQLPVEQSAVFWLKSENLIEDVIGNASIQTIGLPTLVSGQIGSALHFDGDSLIYLETAPDLASSDGFTIEFWVRTAGVNAPLLRWLNGDDYVASIESFSNGLLRWQALNVGTYGSTYATLGTAPLNEWHHVALVHSKADGYMTTYFNGVQSALVDAPYTPELNDELSLVIGGDLSNSVKFVGDIDELTFYDEPLSALAIQQIAAASSFGKCSAGFEPLLVEAGTPITLESVGNIGTLNGDVSQEDATIMWEMVSGSGNLTFSASDQLQTDVSADVEGRYTVKLSAESNGYLVSDTTEIWVGSGCYPVTASPVIWLTGESNLTDVATGGSVETVSVIIEHVPGLVGNAYRFTGYDTALRIPSVTASRVSGNSALTFEFWMDETLIYGGQRVINWQENGVNLTYSGYGNFSLQLENELGESFSVSLSTTRSNITGWKHYAITLDADEQIARLYLNGELRTEQQIGVECEQFNFQGDASLGGRVIGANVYSELRGDLDEFAIYREALDITQIAGIYAAGSAGKCAANLNQPPRVAMNVSRFVSILDGSLLLNAVAIDDGNPSGTLTYDWQLLSGPASVLIDDHTVLSTLVSFTAAGNYNFSLTVSDGEKSTVEEVRIQVTDANFNLAPTVSVGDDVSHSPLETITLSGTAFDSDLAEGETLSINWSQVGGTSLDAFADPSALTQSFSLTTPGIYTFRLTASDGALSSYDDVRVTVLSTVNSAPVVDLGGDQEITFPVNALTLSAVITDDGYPNESMISNWYQTAGPVDVSINVLSTESAEIIFDEVGEYEFVFIANDGVASGEDRVLVTVLPEVLPNTAPQIELGDDLVIDVGSHTLAISVSDDGQPIDGGLTYQWTQLGGPLAASISNATNSSVDIVYGMNGVYTFQLKVSDGEFTVEDTIQVTVDTLDDGASFANLPPAVDLPASHTLESPDTELQFTPVITDDGNPSGTLTYQWSQIDGPDTANTIDTTVESPIYTFAATGIYRFQLVVSDGQFSVISQTEVSYLPTGNKAPVVVAGETQTVELSDTIHLVGTASDDGLPLGNELTYQWDLISYPAGSYVNVLNADTLEADVQVLLGGAYSFLLSVSDGQYTTTDTVVVNVVEAPVVEISYPSDGQTLSDSDLIYLDAFAYATGDQISELTFYDGEVVIGSGSRIGDSDTYTLTLSALSLGDHTITAHVTTASGAVGVSDVTNVTVIDQNEAEMEVEILSPEDSAEIDSSIDITGTVFSTNLDFYSLEYSESGKGNWNVVEQGVTSIRSGVLGSLDTTLLENGLYDIRLLAQNTLGDQVISLITVVLDSELKLGQFTLAFEDLSVPLSGLPITATRAYDSRDQSIGDFGQGWELGLQSMSVVTRGEAGLNWIQTRSGGGFFPVYSLDPANNAKVVVKLPGGGLETFTPVATGSAHSSGVGSTGFGLPALEPNQQYITPITSGNLTFEGTDDAEGSLVVLGEDTFTFTVTGGSVSDTSFGNLYDPFTAAPYNPTQFLYTDKAGNEYQISIADGLFGLTDTNDNTLTFDDNGVYHSDGESITYTRNADGLITAITDPAGEQLLYRYNGNQLIEFENRVGEVTQFFYEEPRFPNYLTRIVDPAGNDAIRSEYDDSGRLVRQIDALGNAIEFEHDISNNREVITDRLGNSTIHEYDNQGYVTRTTDAHGGVTTYGYDAYGNETSVTTPEGVTTQRDYTQKGDLLSETNGAGETTYYDYNSQSNPLSITDALGRVTSMAYSGSNLSSMTDSAGTTTSFGYSYSGNLSSLADATGTVTSYTHDSKGRELSMSLTDSDGAVLRTETYEYDDLGNRTKSTTTRTLVDATVETLVSTYVYDAESRLLSSTLPDGTTTSTEYNSIGKQSISTDALGRETTYSYDDRGNMVSMTYPDGTSSFTAYDVEGRRTASTDQLGITTYYIYDALGRLVETILPDDTMPATVLSEVADILTSPELADNPSVTTEYDGDGRVVASIDALGNRMEYEYDAASRRVLVRDALGNETLTSYDAAGQQTAVTDALGRITSFEYDTAGRLLQTIFPDATTTQVSYDALGRRSTVTDQEGNTTGYEYDDLGRMVAVIDALGNRTEYEYNEQGSLLIQRDAEGRETSFVYDSLGRRTTRTLPEGQQETVSYNALGNMLTREDFNGHTTSYAYDIMNRVTSITADSSHPSLNLGLANAPAKFEYAYDDLGRRISSTVKDSSDATIHQRAWEFNTRGQNIRKTSTNGNISYAYDDNGNLTGAASDTAGAYDQSYDYDALNRLSDVYVGQEGLDPAAYGLAAYAYDNVGNLTGVGYANGTGHQYEYSALNRLTDLTVGKMSSGTDPPSGTIASIQQQYTYTLNAAGHRTGIAELSGRSISHVFDKLYRLKSETIAGAITNNGAISYTHDKVGNRLSRTSSVSSVSSVVQNYSSNDLLT